MEPSMAYLELQSLSEDVPCGDTDSGDWPEPLIGRVDRVSEWVAISGSRVEASKPVRLLSQPGLYICPTSCIKLGHFSCGLIAHLSPLQGQLLIASVVATPKKGVLLARFEPYQSFGEKYSRTSSYMLSRECTDPNLMMPLRMVFGQDFNLEQFKQFVSKHMPLWANDNDKGRSPLIAEVGPGGMPLVVSATEALLSIGIISSSGESVRSTSAKPTGWLSRLGQRILGS